MSTEPTSEQTDLLHFEIKRISPTELKQRQKTGKKILWSIGIIGVVLIGITFILQPSADSAAIIEEEITESNEQNQMATTSNETTTETISEINSEQNESIHPIDHTIESNSSSEPLKSEPQQENTIAESVKETESITQKVTKEEDKQKASAKKELQSELKYYLIAGSFDNENNAAKLVKQLESSGHWAINLGKLGSSYKVSIGAYETKSEADNKRKELMRNGIETWVLNH